MLGTKFIRFLRIFNFITVICSCLFVYVDQISGNDGILPEIKEFHAFLEQSLNRTVLNYTISPLTTSNIHVSAILHKVDVQLAKSSNSDAVKTRIFSSNYKLFLFFQSFVQYFFDRMKILTLLLKHLHRIQIQLKILWQRHISIHPTYQH